MGNREWPGGGHDVKVCLCSPEGNKKSFSLLYFYLYGSFALFLHTHCWRAGGGGSGGGGGCRGLGGAAIIIADRGVAGDGVRGGRRSGWGGGGLKKKPFALASLSDSRR